MRTLALAAALAITGCATHQPDPPTTQPPTHTATTFCGPDPTHTSWQQQMATLATIGITTTYGPCRTPPTNYTVLEPGSRYATPAEYLQLTTYAQQIGTHTIIYDARLWGTDLERAQAVADWLPYAGTVTGVDLGDEPSYADLPELARRALLVAVVAPPVAFFLADGVQGQALSESVRQLPLPCPGSDRYDDLGLALNDAAEIQGLAGCATIAVDVTGRNMDGDGDRYNTGLMAAAFAAGYQVTLFGGLAPDNFPTWSALVDGTGRLTTAGRLVRNALK